MLELDTGSILAQKNISVQIRKVGQEHCDPRKRHELRTGGGGTYRYSSLHFVLFGRGRLIANGTEYPLSKGDAFLLYTGEQYEYYPDVNDPWSYIWIDFYTDDAKALFEPAGFTPEKPVVRIPSISVAAITGLLKLLYEAYDASNLQEMRCSGYFVLVLCELIRNAEQSFATGSYIKQRSLRNILTYINNNFRLPLTLAKIAAENQISVSYMMAIFAELLGMSPIAYLNRFRVSKARELLQSTDSPVGEVARAVGVEDPLYFSRVFKKQTGCSPRAYRAEGNKENPYGWMKEKDIDFR